jgi:hypothetical protein
VFAEAAAAASPGPDSGPGSNASGPHADLLRVARSGGSGGLLPAGVAARMLPVLLQLAEVRRRQKRFGEAEGLCRRALGVAGMAYPPNHPEVAGVKSALAQVRPGAGLFSGRVAVGVATDGLLLEGCALLALLRLPGSTHGTKPNSPTLCPPLGLPHVGVATRGRRAPAGGAVNAREHAGAGAPEGAGSARVLGERVVL